MSVNQFLLSALLSTGPAAGEPSAAADVTTPAAPQPTAPARAEAPASAAPAMPAPTPPQPVVIMDGHAIPTYTDPALRRDRLEAHRERDDKLKATTIGFGVATGVLGAIGAGMVAGSARADQGQTALLGAGGFFLAGASVTAIGTIISAVVWGNHKNLRPLLM